MPGDTRMSLMVTNAVNIFLIVFFIIFSVVIVVIIQNLTLTYQWQKFYQNRYWKGKQKLNPFVLAKVPRDTFDGWRWSFSYLGRGVIVIVFNSVQGQRFKDLLWDQVCTSMNCDIVSHAQKLFTSYSLCPVSKGSIAALANWPPLCTFCTTRTIISSRVLTWKWPTHSLSQFLWKVFWPITCSATWPPAQLVKPVRPKFRLVLIKAVRAHTAWLVYVGTWHTV